MKQASLPADSTLYTDPVFRETEKYHRRQARMSFARKLEVLAKLLDMRKHLPRLPR